MLKHVAKYKLVNTKLTKLHPQNLHLILSKRWTKCNQVYAFYTLLLGPK